MEETDHYQYSVDDLVLVHVIKGDDVVARLMLDKVLLERKLGREH